MADGYRITLTVDITLDSIPGVMHTRASAVETIQMILNQSVGHYDPVVTAK